MLYVLAVIFPPVSLLMIGKPLKALINLVLWCCFIIPAIIHAMFVIDDYREKKYLEQEAESA